EAVLDRDDRDRISVFGGHVSRRTRKPRQVAEELNARTAAELRKNFISISHSGRPQCAGEGAVMRKQMIENAAYELATQVRAVEDSIEAALIELAELQSRMVRARAATGAAFVTSHPAFE